MKDGQAWQFGVYFSFFFCLMEKRGLKDVQGWPFPTRDPQWYNFQDESPQIMSHLTKQGGGVAANKFNQ